jgi:hypothetical protein
MPKIFGSCTRIGGIEAMLNIKLILKIIVIKHSEIMTLLLRQLQESQKLIRWTPF